MKTNIKNKYGNTEFVIALILGIVPEIGMDNYGKLGLSFSIPTGWATSGMEKVSIYKTYQNSTYNVKYEHGARTMQFTEGGQKIWDAFILECEKELKNYISTQ